MTQEEQVINTFRKVLEEKKFEIYEFCFLDRSGFTPSNFWTLIYEGCNESYLKEKYRSGIIDIDMDLFIFRIPKQSVMKDLSIVEIELKNGHKFKWTPSQPKKLK